MPLFLHFASDFNISVQLSTKTYGRATGLRENPRRESRALLRGVNEFLRPASVVRFG